jgi:hypothetical protein
MFAHKYGINVVFIIDRLEFEKRVRMDCRGGEDWSQLVNLSI